MTMVAPSSLVPPASSMGRRQRPLLPPPPRASGGAPSSLLPPRAGGSMPAPSPRAGGGTEEGSGAWSESARALGWGARARATSAGSGAARRRRQQLAPLLPLACRRRAHGLRGASRARRGGHPCRAGDRAGQARRRRPPSSSSAAEARNVPRRPDPGRGTMAVTWQPTVVLARGRATTTTARTGCDEEREHADMLVE